MADTNTGGGANIGRDASAGGNLAGRDMTSAHVEGNVSGMGVGSGNRVDIHTDRSSAKGDTDSEILHDLRSAMLGDPFNRRNNPGLVSTVDELLDKVASLVAANAAQSYRQDKADQERALITSSQQTLVEMQERLKAESEDRFRALDGRQSSFESSQTAAMIIVWITLALVMAEGVYLAYLSLKLLGS